MELHEIPITSLIPQRPPFVMVDRVLSCDLSEAVTEFTVREDNIFLDDGLLSPAGIIESMAQSCAARMGCVNRMHGEAVKIGFIGDIRNCQIIRQPRCQEVLTTHVNIIEDVFNLTLANVTVNAGDEVIATARIKIALSDMKAAEPNPS
jgi:predicted hotdog family 3-hydroxylacyl-ACP dehydratase